MPSVIVGAEAQETTPKTFKKRITPPLPVPPEPQVVEPPLPVPPSPYRMTVPSFRTIIIEDKRNSYFLFFTIIYLFISILFIQRMN